MNVEIIALPESPVKTTNVFENIVENGFSGGFYWMRNAEGKTYRFNTALIVLIIELPREPEKPLIGDNIARPCE